MPKAINAVQCEGCKKLLPTTSRYLRVANFQIVHEPSEFDNDWKKKNQTPTTLEDVAFCDEHCLSEFVLDIRFKE
jgi:hypothetical protein